MTHERNVAQTIKEVYLHSGLPYYSPKTLVQYPMGSQHSRQRRRTPDSSNEGHKSRSRFGLKVPETRYSDPTPETRPKIDDAGKESRTQPNSILVPTQAPVSTLLTTSSTASKTVAAETEGASRGREALPGVAERVSDRISFCSHPPPACFKVQRHLLHLSIAVQTLNHSFFPTSVI